MPRDLFGDVVHPNAGLGSRKWYTLPLSLALHTAIVAVLVIVPLMAADVLPSILKPMEFLDAMPAVPAPPPASVPRAAPKPSMPVDNPDAPPAEVPSGIKPETGLVVEPEVTSAVEGGLANTIAGTVTAGLPEPPPPPPPAAPIRISSGVRQPAKVKQVNPIYPDVAQRARIEGTVIIDAVIGVDGQVKETRVLRSIPLLDQAALDAVRQWVFTPTLLNGVPVPVLMTVTVTFKLK